MNGIKTLIKPHSTPLSLTFCHVGPGIPSLQRMQQQEDTLEAELEPSSDIEPAGALVLDFPGSKIMKK
jgi:hypothetical protein